MGEDFPAVRSAAALHPLGVDRDHDALVAELFRGFLDEFAATDGGAIDRDLVRAGLQQRPDIVDRAHAAAHRQRHEAGFRRAPDHIQHDAAIFMRRRDVEKAELVSAGGVIGDRRFHGVAGVAQIDEVDALDHPAVLDVEAGDHAHLEHVETPKRPPARCGSAPARRLDQGGRHRARGRRSRRPVSWRAVEAAPSHLRWRQNRPRR